MAVAFNSEPVKPVHDKDRESVQSCTVSFGGGGGGGVGLDLKLYPLARMFG